MSQESETKGLDPWVFFALVRHESGWVPWRVRHYGRSCDVGLGQVQIVHCTRGALRLLLDPVHNLRESAAIQQHHMRYCYEHGCEGGWLYYYNRSMEYVRLVIEEAEEARHEFASEVRPASSP